MPDDVAEGFLGLLLFAIFVCFYIFLSLESLTRDIIITVLPAFCNIHSSLYSISPILSDFYDSMFALFLHINVKVIKKFLAVRESDCFLSISSKKYQSLSEKLRRNTLSLFKRSSERSF